MKWLKFFYKWFKAFVICLVFVKLTTFGWMPSVDNGSKELVLDSAQRLEATVRFLSQKIGVRDYEHLQNLNQTADYIAQSFRDLGYSLKEVTYRIDNNQFRNILAFKGDRFPDQAILVGAHYDTCANPGADDNASGIAGLLELARQFKGKDLPIVFAAFTNEEPPFFTTPNMGSYVVARHFKESNVSLKGIVILEMLGYYSDRLFSQRYLPAIGMFYPNQANFIAVVGNFSSHALVSDLVKGFKKDSSFPIHSITAPSSIPGIYFSDHWSFWQMGYPAVMVTDTAFLRYPHYHHKTDRPENLDYPRMARVVQGLVSAITFLTQP